MNCPVTIDPNQIRTRLPSGLCYKIISNKLKELEPVLFTVGAPNRHLLLRTSSKA